MIDKTDVVKELAVKNKEIYLNKLDMDIDSYYELLKLTTTNIIDLSINEVVSGVLNIENSFFNKKNIENKVREFFKDYLHSIEKIYSKKVKDLKSKKGEINYLDYIDNSILDDIRSYYLNSFSLIVEELSEGYIQEEKEKLLYFINQSFYNRFMIKIFDSLKNANMLLINNYHESTKRYNLINEKTLK